MHLLLETEGVIRQVLGQVFPPPPSALSLPSASPPRVRGGVGAGCPVGSPSLFFFRMSGDTFEHTPPDRVHDVDGSDSGISLQSDNEAVNVPVPASPVFSFFRLF